MNGKVLFSKKEVYPAVQDARYWANKGMHDFMPSRAYLVPVEGNGRMLPLCNIKDRIVALETEKDPYNMHDAYVELAGDAKYLIITIGCYAT